MSSTQAHLRDRYDDVADRNLACVSALAWLGISVAPSGGLGAGAACEGVREAVDGAAGSVTRWSQRSIRYTTSTRGPRVDEPLLDDIHALFPEKPTYVGLH